MESVSEKVTWKEVTALPVCRTAHTAVALHENIYIGGGSEEVYDVQMHDFHMRDYRNCYRLDVYNLTTNQWTSPIITPCSWFAMTVLDNNLLIVGGSTRNRKISKKVLFLNSGNWEDYSEMPSARFQATAVGYKSTLIVIGGVANMVVSSSIELLDITNGCWYACNDLPSPCSQIKAAIIDDKLYLLGGFDDTRSSSRTLVASLSTISNYKLNWQSLPNTPWYFTSAAVLHNKFLLAVGGRKQSDVTSQTSEVCILNPSNGQWEWITNIPEARSLPAVVSMDDKIIVIGGTNVNRKYSKHVWIGKFM